MLTSAISNTSHANHGMFVDAMIIIMIISKSVQQHMCILHMHALYLLNVVHKITSRRRRLPTKQSRNCRNPIHSRIACKFFQGQCRQKMEKSRHIIFFYCLWICYTTQNFNNTHLFFNIFTSTHQQITTKTTRIYVTLSRHHHQSYKGLTHKRVKAGLLFR